ncbi:hypothetical protein Vadar_013937 [Vaccinium darrowii]|uniref:Uncharacterized protein n=1 Tax=Vaccinium darrowii TaxID=229202 RepID=A0ACB7ZJF9_9ERIC|nr:hypothetical protein Vadar_013937 [Vaccinium darrowii]
MDFVFTGQYFVNDDDTVAQQVYFESDEVHACIVTCGGLCPGINTVIREIVCGLHYMYGVNRFLGIEGGYRGFYSRNTIPLTPKDVNDIHKRGGTILGTSRGGHDTSKIVDSIQDRGINQVYIIGGDGTQKGASVIFEEIQRCGLKVAVAGIPKTIDNDIPVIDKSFGFDTAVEEAQRAINAAHVEAESFENGVGVVKLMGRFSGFIAMYATLASRDVDCCLIPESPFYLEGPGGLFDYMEKRLKENGHLVIVIAEGAGQELLSECLSSMDQQDASGNKLLHDVGLWISQKIKCNPRCMAGYTGFTVGPVNGRHAYIPFYRVIERQNKVVITDRMWTRVLSSTNQPSFLDPRRISEANKDEPQPQSQLLDGESGVCNESTSKQVNVIESKALPLLIPP